MDRERTVKLYDGRGYVKLVRHMGHELVPAEAARTSFGKGLKGREKDLNLIRFLLQNDHGTPFEHVVFTFEAEVPIFVARQVMRHRIGFSWNELSGRYKRLDGDYWLPSEERVGESVYALDRLWEAIDFAVGTYQELVDEFGVPREVARAVLPLATMTQIYFTANLRALMHFWQLRISEHAQPETREFAEATKMLVRGISSGFAELVDLIDSEVLDRVYLTRRELEALDIKLRDDAYHLTEGERERLVAKLKLDDDAVSS